MPDKALPIGGPVGLDPGGVISGKLAKVVLEEMFQTGRDPKAIVEGRGMVQMTDPELILPVVDEVLGPPPLGGRISGGKNKVFGYFVGNVMKRTRGQANPKLVNEILKKKLEEGRKVKIRGIP